MDETNKLGTRQKREQSFQSLKKRLSDEVDEARKMPQSDDGQDQLADAETDIRRQLEEVKAAIEKEGTGDEKWIVEEIEGILGRTDGAYVGDNIKEEIELERALSAALPAGGSPKGDALKRSQKKSNAASKHP